MASTDLKAASKGARPVAKGTARLPGKPSAKAANRRKKSPVDVAIANKLAPAAAIALLGKTEHAAGVAPALEILGAGVSRAEDEGMIRVQLAFDGGEILPVEMSAQAGKALAAGLSEELGTQAKLKPAR